MSTPQASQGKSLGRLVVLAGSTVGSAGLGFLVQFALARALDMAEFGHVAALLAIVNILAPLTSCGVGWLWFQVYGSEGWSAHRWMSVSLRAVGLSSTAAVVLMVVYVSTTERQSTASICVEMVVILLAQGLTELTASRLQLEERFGLLAAWQLLIPTGRVIAVTVVLAIGYRSLADVLVAYAIVAGISCAVSIVSLEQVRRGRIRLAGHGAVAKTARPAPGLREVFATSAPFILMTTFYLVYSQGIVAIVERLLGPDDAATYNVAFLVLSAVFLAPSVIYTKFLVSKIFRWWAQDRPMFVATLHVGVATQFVLGIISMVIVLIAAPVVVPLLFGARYATAVPLIMVLAPAIPIRFVQHSYASAFYSPQHMWRKVSYMGIAAALSLCLNVVLTARIGLTGAALSAVVAELSLLLLFFWGTARHIDGVDVWATFNLRVLRQSVGYIRAARERVLT